MAKMEICEYCGKRKKRFRSAFSSWICDNCKKETNDYENPDAFIKIEAQDWWNRLSDKQKIEIYLEKQPKSDNKNSENKEILKED